MNKIEIALLLSVSLSYFGNQNKGMIFIFRTLLALFGCLLILKRNGIVLF